MNEHTDLSQDILKDIKWHMRMVSKSLTMSARTRWPKGARIPLLTHQACRDKIWRKRRETGMYEESAVIKKEVIDGQAVLEMDRACAWLVISRDQITASATDLVKCRCSACGKRFRLNAGYLEALSLLADQAEYLSEM